MSESIKLKGGHTGFEYTWITVPPVTELVYGMQVENTVRSMTQSLESYGGTTLPRKLGNEDDDLPAMRWYERVQGALKILGWIKNGQELNLCYWCVGVPVGIICIMPGDFYITELVTHPAVANAGEILIEAACNRSQLSGCGGKLKLQSWNKASTGFYLSVGFVKKDGNQDMGGSMTLDPAGNDCWKRLNERWVLIKYSGMSYYKSFKTVPKPPNLQKN